MHWTAYNTSKAAVLQMARSMACELGAKKFASTPLAQDTVVDKQSPQTRYLGKELGVRFFQILTQIVKMNHLRSFSHDVLAWPEFWARKPHLFVMEKPGLGREYY